MTPALSLGVKLRSSSSFKTSLNMSCTFSNKGVKKKLVAPPVLWSGYCGFAITRGTGKLFLLFGIFFSGGSAKVAK